MGVPVMEVAVDMPTMEVASGVSRNGFSICSNSEKLKNNGFKFELQIFNPKSNFRSETSKPNFDRERVSQGVRERERERRRRRTTLIAKEFVRQWIGSQIIPPANLDWDNDKNSEKPDLDHSMRLNKFKDSDDNKPSENEEQRGWRRPSCGEK